MGFFIIRDILNGTEGVIKHLFILRGNMHCGKVQDRRYFTGMGRTIPKKYAAPEILLPAGKLLTV